MRERILFDDNWRFHRGDLKQEDSELKGIMYISAKTERYHTGPAAPAHLAEADPYDNFAELNNERWDKVTLPHDYLFADTRDPHKNCTLGFVSYDNGWYRKKFTLPKEDLGRRITLLFEGVATHATVYLNGCLMKHSFTGYTPFEVDITDVARYGEENVLAVYVETSEHEGWWYEGAGIYRHVYLTKTAPLALDLYGIYASPEKLSQMTWRVTVENTVHYDAATPASTAYRTLTEILTADGTVVAKGESRGEVRPYEKSVGTLSVTLTDPHLWDTDDPYLYTCRTTVFSDEGEVDRDEVRFGFRTVEMSPVHGLFLNGRHILLKGVCGHESFGLTGKACPDNIFREKVLTVKEMGANAFRMSHYPQSPVLMDACDEYGLLVMDETRWFESTEEGISQLETMIRRDRNRPSVIMWSVGNEEPLFITEQGRRICRHMMSVVRRLDPTRPVMTANDKSPTVATVYDECDIIGINYNLNLFDAVHAAHPEKAIFSSENCATGSVRGWYYPDDPTLGRVSAYDKDTNAWFLGREKTWKFFTEREWILGGFQWHAYEYLGEATYPRRCSISGAIDLFWQKKDAFYQNLSLWGEKPMLHLLPHWNFEGREGESIRVVAYTNCEEAELFLNGESLGVCKVETYGHAEWQVPYTPGVLEAVGRKGGVVCASDRRETAGRGARLDLSLMNQLPLHAGGTEMALISCRVLDEKGREVPTASPTITFTTNGRGTVYSTGSDNTDGTSIRLSVRKMYAGRATAAVLVGETAGTLVVYAEADGLATGRVEIPLATPEQHGKQL